LKAHKKIIFQNKQ